jgi:hypothetical protein
MGDFETGMPAPGDEFCSRFGGVDTVALARGDEANVYPCILTNVPAKAELVDVVFFVKARTVGFPWWPWEVQKRDKWRLARAGKTFAWARATPLPSRQDNTCSDEQNALGANRVRVRPLAHASQ